MGGEKRREGERKGEGKSFDATDVGVDTWREGRSSLAFFIAAGNPGLKRLVYDFSVLGVSCIAEFWLFGRKLRMRLIFIYEFINFIRIFRMVV